jgi:hypothetical protein
MFRETKKKNHLAYSVTVFGPCNFRFSKVSDIILKKNTQNGKDLHFALEKRYLPQLTF